MGLKGNLHDISLENIFQMLFLERKGGLLSIQHGERRAEVFLEKGRISFAKIGGQGEGKRVKLAVIKNEYLTEQEWERYVDTTAPPKVEKILSDLFAHIDKELFSFLFMREMGFTFFCLLQWREGLYEYSPGKRPSIDKTLCKSIAGEQVLLEALREVENWRGVQAKLPSMNSSVVMVDNLLSVAANVKYTLTPDEAYLASMASEEINLEDLLNSSKLSCCETGKIIGQFMSHRLLRVRRGIKEVPPPEEEPTERPGSGRVKFAVLLVLIISLLLISDATFFESGMRRSLLHLLGTNSSEIVPVMENASHQNEGIKEPMALENRSSVEGAGSAPAPVDESLRVEEDDSVREAPGLEPVEQEYGGNEEDGARIKDDLAMEPDLGELSRRAENGDIEAQVSLGFIYDFGRGVIEEDDVRAAHWYRRAAEEGFHAEAQFNLGVMYKNGEGVEPDSIEAARWYRKAASQGNSQARYNLALMYLEGGGLEPDKERALELLYRAGVSFLQEGNDKAVVQVVNVLKKIDPESGDAKKLLLKTYGEN